MPLTAAIGAGYHLVNNTLHISKGYSTKGHLGYTSIHEKIKDVICTECGKQFSAMDHLRRLYMKTLNMLSVLSVVNSFQSWVI